MANIEERILEYLRSADEPKSINDICEALGVLKRSVVISLNKLVEAGEIVSVAASKNRRYYIANNEGITAGDYPKLKTKSLELLVPAKAATDAAKEELEEIRKEIKNIYANIISIMAVFVAIFSIVFAGGNYLFQSANSVWTWHTLVAFFAAEAGVIIAVLVMLNGIKRFLNR